MGWVFDFDLGVHLSAHLWMRPGVHPGVHLGVYPDRVHPGRVHAAGVLQLLTATYSTTTTYIYLQPPFPNHTLYHLFRLQTTFRSLLKQDMKVYEGL